MKKAFLVGVLCLGLASPAMAITEVQGVIGSIFQAFKFELVPSKVIGGPQSYKVTKDTIKTLQKHLDNGDTIVIEGDGSIKVQPAPKK